MSISSSQIPSPSSSSGSISPASDFLQYVVTRESNPPLLQAPVTEVRVRPRRSYRKHVKYYFSDGNIIFLVDGLLYNIHRYFFQRDSPNFASMFSKIPHGGCGKGLTDDEPIMLSQVTTQDFDLFLSILYPPDFGVHAATTVTEWTAILDLAVNWNFKSIQALAIKQLACIASPIDKIVVGRKHDIEEWLDDAYEAVFVRDEPLTLEEGNRLGMEDVIKISATRQRIHRQQLPLQSELASPIRDVVDPEPIDMPEVILPIIQNEANGIDMQEVIPLVVQNKTDSIDTQEVIPPIVQNETDSISAPTVATPPSFQLPAVTSTSVPLPSALSPAILNVTRTPALEPSQEKQKQTLAAMLKRHKNERERLPYWKYVSSASVLLGTLSFTPTLVPVPIKQKNKVTKMLKRHKSEREALPYWKHATSADVLSGTLC